MALSGHKLVSTAGTRVALSSGQVVNCPVALKALDSNSGLIYVGDASVDAASGFELDDGETIIFDFVGNLANIWIDSSVDSEGVAWLLLTV